MKNGQTKLPLVLAVSGSVLAAGALPAVAQDPGTPEDLPVNQRARPEFDPVGFRYGNVFLYPSISVAEAYDSNVFATENDEESDFITYVTPSISARSEGTRGGWRAALKADLGFYANEDDENFLDASATAGASYDVIADGRLDADIGYHKLHEDRSSPDDIRGTEPTEYYRADGRLAYRHRFNRLSAGAELIGRHYDYDDTSTSSGSIDNSDRNRFETEEAVRLGYDLFQDYSIFTRGALIQWNYEDDISRGGVDRDANGYRVDAGVTANLTGLLTMEASVGYLSMDYDDANLDSTQGMAAGLRAIWNVTRLTTLTATIDREIEATTVAGASSRFDTLGQLEVDHELLRNLILSGQVSYLNSDFDGTSREDDRYGIGVSAKYLVTQGVAVSASVERDERDSNVPGGDFTRDVFLLRLTYGL